jgi:hypothetical protein
MFLLCAADKAAAAAAAKKAKEDGVYFVLPFGFIIEIMVVITAVNYIFYCDYLLLIYYYCQGVILYDCIHILLLLYVKFHDI